MIEKSECVVFPVQDEIGSGGYIESGCKKAIILHTLNQRLGSSSKVLGTKPVLLVDDACLQLNHEIVPDKLLTISRR